MKVAIVQKIYEVRGQRIMLDFDLAELYEVETRVLNQTVKRNIKRFPIDFIFQLDETEGQHLRSQISPNNDSGNSNSSQIVMSSKHRGIKYLPYAFTEHGVTMLASILKSDKSIAMNIAIVRAFIALRQFALNYKEPAEQINELRNTIGNHDKQLINIYEALENLLNESKERKKQQKKWANRERIGFKPKE